MRKITTLLSLILCIGIAHGQITDKRDGKTYKTVKIGNQVWMAENLAYKPSSGQYNQFGNYWAYDDDNSNVAKYGYLYDWFIATEVCPSGWHLPSDKEWTILTDYLGGENVAGTKMKSTSGWQGNGNGTNESGFNFLPGGSRSTPGNAYTFQNVGKSGNAWTSSMPYATIARSRYMYHHKRWAYRSNTYKGFGLSVRCVKD